MSEWKQYLKFIVQVFFAGVSALVAALVDDTVDAAEWINVLIVVLGAISVLGAGNLPAGVWAYAKTIVAGAAAGAVLLVSFIIDGGMITTSEWLQVALAAVGAAGVLAAPGPRVFDAVEVARRTAGLRNGPAV